MYLAMDWGYTGLARPSDAGARQAAWLFVAAGTLVSILSYVPADATVSRAVLVSLGLASVLIGVLVWVLPWHRWPVRSTLVLVPISFALIVLGNRFGTVSPYTYGVFYVVVFCWLGLAHPRWTSVRVAPLAAIAYLIPAALDASHRGEAAYSVLSTISVCILVGETIAWAMCELATERAISEHRAHLLRSVARAGGTISALDSDAVLAGVVDTLIGIGFDVAFLCVFDDATDTYVIVQPRGVPDQYSQTPQPASRGVPALVRRQRSLVTIAAYAEHELAIPAFAALGIRTTVAAPVWVQGKLEAALIAMSTRELATRSEDTEAFELLAAQAGRALENALRYEEERRAREVLAEVSMRDELTGVGNRRHAVGLLDSLQPGDAVVLIDLDHFKDVNDSDGHAEGDRVLIALADHLRQGVRDADLIARYGGEEFLVVLRQSGNHALQAVERLVDAWRSLRPRTTYSAGVAVHRPDTKPALTLARADDALYAAKRMGRDRVSEFGFDETAFAPGA
jgi:diguanylate cyclase (GGDEF)-like protein